MIPTDFPAVLNFLARAAAAAGISASAAAARESGARRRADPTDRHRRGRR